MQAASVHDGALGCADHERTLRRRRTPSCGVFAVRGSGQQRWGSPSSQPENNVLSHSPSRCWAWCCPRTVAGARRAAAGVERGVGAAAAVGPAVVAAAAADHGVRDRPAGVRRSVRRAPRSSRNRASEIADTAWSEAVDPGARTGSRPRAASWLTLESRPASSSGSCESQHRHRVARHRGRRAHGRRGSQSLTGDERSFAADVRMARTAGSCTVDPDAAEAEQVAQPAGSGEANRDSTTTFQSRSSGAVRTRARRLASTSSNPAFDRRRAGRGHRRANGAR